MTCLQAHNIGAKNCLTIIHRADRLDEMLSLLRGRAAGIVVFPLWPRAGDGETAPDAKRIIVQARKGSKAPLRLAAGLTLHGPDGAFTEAAEDILRWTGALAL